MGPQANIDVDIINQLIVDGIRKDANVFQLNRLKNAVFALQKQDPIIGAEYLAAYYSFINDLDAAISTLDCAISKFGPHNNLIKAKLNIVIDTADWILIKSFMKSILLNKNYEVNDEDKVFLIERYIYYANLYLDNSTNFDKFIASYSSLNLSEFHEVIRKRADILLKENLSIDNLRKLIKITLNTVIAKYNATISLRLGLEDNKKFILSYNEWSIDEAIELTKEINNAILSVDDTEFQLEADEFEVFCINFDIDKLPNDFSLYSDDDEDEELVKLVQSRMESNPQFEVLDV